MKAPGVSALFIGAHADDVEIGAGGTTARMVADGWDVHVCILTSERDRAIAGQRADEARKAAAALGVPESRVFFMDEEDAGLACNGETVAKFRSLLQSRNLNPDIVLTHTLADSHGDHRAAHELTRSVFRKKPILSFGVINSLIPTEFKPRIFVEVSKYDSQRRSALNIYATQANRIQQTEMSAFRKRYADAIDAVDVEPFEILLQEGAGDALYLALSLNDCPFHNFWYPIIRSQGLVSLHSVPIYRQLKEWDWSPTREREGVSQLFTSFARLWHDLNPLQDVGCDSPSAERALQNSNCLLIGSAASNHLIRTYFNHFEGIRYVTDYSMPNYRNLRILDRTTGQMLLPDYSDGDFGNRTVVEDIAVLTVMNNPQHSMRSLVGCMGVHGFGTYACLKVLSDQSLLKDLLHIVPAPGSRGFQILLRYNESKNRVQLISESLHLMK